MPAFQTNVGNIVLTSSKLHIRAIRHTFSEIRTKGDLVIKASQSNDKGQNLLVEADGKHGFDLKNINFRS